MYVQSRNSVYLHIEAGHTYLYTYIPTHTPIYLYTYIPIYIGMGIGIHTNAHLYTCLYLERMKYVPVTHSGLTLFRFTTLE